MADQMHRLLVCFGNAEFGRLGLCQGLQSAVAVPRVCLALAKYDLQARAGSPVLVSVAPAPSSPDAIPTRLGSLTITVIVTVTV